MRLLPVSAAELPIHWPMVERFLAHYMTTKDSEAGGERVNPREDLRYLLTEGGAEMVLMEGADGVVVGCAAHVPSAGYLEGLLLWVEPEHRHRGHLREFFELMRTRAREQGFLGLRFQSKLWHTNGPERLGFARAGALIDGGEQVTAWVMEV